MGQSSVGDRFKVGDMVWVPLAVGRACGTIVEDRGPLGIAGEHLFRVSVPDDPYSVREFLVNASEIARLDNGEQQELRTQLPTDAIEDFLLNGGLVSILRQNTPERVWLRRDQFGNVTYTLIEGYSTTGGRQPPRYVLRGERILAPRQGEVLEFVKSLGLSENRAKDVLAAIGTAP